MSEENNKCFNCGLPAVAKSNTNGPSLYLCEGHAKLALIAGWNPTYIDRKASIMQKIICDFDGCEEEVCEEDMTLTPPTMRFCKDHSDQFNQLIKDKDIRGMLSFHVRSLGGAEKAAHANR